MINEVICKCYIPRNSDDWVLILTQSNNIYSLRLGGYKKEDNARVNFEDYNIIDKDQYLNVKIKKVYTDNEWVYIILYNDFIVTSGWASINNEGDPSLGIMFTHINDYEKDFFLEDMYCLLTGENGDSEYS